MNISLGRWSVERESHAPFTQLFSWPNPTSTLSSIAYNTHQRKQISLDTFWPSSIWLFMLFQLFFWGGCIKDKHGLWKKKKIKKAPARPFQGPALVPRYSHFSAWFNYSCICQHPIGLRCDSDCPRASESLPKYPSRRAQLRNALPRTKPSLQGEGLLGREGKWLLSPSLLWI